MRTYMKPVMESENFIANEFVAACWTIGCTSCDAKETSHSTSYSEGQAWVETGNFGGKAPCTNQYDTSNNPVDTWEEFLSLVLRGIFTGMSWDEFWDAVEAGETITVNKPIHNIVVTKGITGPGQIHPDKDWFYPNASV